MVNKGKKYVYFLFLLTFISFTVSNMIQGSQWALDNMVAIVLWTIVWFSNRWLKLGKLGLTLIGCVFLIHNLGSFGWYYWSSGRIAYDNIVHFFNSLVAAFVIFNFVARKLHIKKGQRVRETVVDEHKAIMFFLVIASVAMLGTIVEVIEFFGFFFLSPGEGMFFAGAGDSDAIGHLAGEYIDTMTDIIVNTLGSILGVMIYYFAKYKKQPWLRYSP